MSSAALRPLLASGQVWLGARSGRAAPSAWGLAEVAGRFIELTRDGASAAWTAALALVRDAQLLGEPVIWVARPGASFFPPDAAAGGIDLASLALVSARDLAARLRAVDCLLRSGAFGLVVLELEAEAEIPLPVQVRLAGLLQKHDAVLLCLTERASRRGSFASLRAVSARTRIGEGRFRCALRMVKDKRRGQEWECAQVLRGPMGLR